MNSRIAAGPSGSGKSTLFNMIGGLDKPSSGKVFIDEVDIAQLDAYELAWLRCRKIGYIFQTFNIIQVMTALENVTLPMVFAGLNNDTAVEKGMQLLDLVGLEDRFSHKPFELSGGQQQRVAVARHPVLVGIQARQHAGVGVERGRRVGVEGVEAQALGRHPVQVRGQDLGRLVVAADIAVTQIVREEEDDVGTLARRPSRGNTSRQNEDCQHDHLVDERELLERRIAEVRGLPEGEPAISPARFPDWTTPAHFREFAEEVRERTGGIPVGFKLSANHIERDIDFALEASADYIILDGRGGGTGAAPLSFSDHVALPFKLGFSRVYRVFDERDVHRDVVWIGASWPA